MLKAEILYERLARNMLKRFTLKNYKNFKDEICIDFADTAGYQFSTDCIADGMISKMLIYGRNATGKTNLGKALMNIYFTLVSEAGHMNEGVFLNADSNEKSALFSYVFQFNDRELVYRYRRLCNKELMAEELWIDGIAIFQCDFSIHEYQFHNLKYIHAETANTERYLQSLDDGDDMEEIRETKLPFLRWLISNVAFDSNSVLIRLSNYVRRMVMITVGNNMLFYSKARFSKSLENYNGLQDLEEFLNVMGIKCKLVLEKLPDGQSKLYYAHEQLIPFFENVSSGTLALVDLYQRIILQIRNATFIYLDEFDAFYHYEMSENVIRYIKKRFLDCQVILTSHNTNLMTNRFMRPDCVFILSETGKLTALCNATHRELREGHNLEKMYISGEFEQYE